MKKMEYQNVRGTQDFLPQAEAVRRNIRRTLEDTFILYGCKTIETPILNYSDLMTSKYAGGAEILQEMYTLSDRGDRKLALRYDLTIPFAKVVAMNPNFAMPFKRYEIGKVFRDGPIKAGRFREFTQCDVDIVGVESQSAEAELMMMAVDAFEKLNVKIQIQYNNRKLLYGLLQIFEVRETVMDRVILILDKMEKIDRATLIKELSELDLADSSLRVIMQFLEAPPTLDYFKSLTEQNEFVKQGVAELCELMDYLAALQIDALCIFNPFLARGLEIYTGTIYEIFIADGTIKSSIGSGGRYDNAIGGLIGTGQQYATVGISFGLDVIYTAFELAGKVEQNLCDIDIYIIPINTEKQALQLATKLRNAGNRVEDELTGKKVRKAMDKANRENIAQVIVLGEEEVHNNSVKLKDMKSGNVKEMEFTFN
ncbi:histidine--tRNA ligase [Solibacillus silvestris]|uniref:histidine--tRNA ligase n=1 Tax=Solibacillus silvestris TaxID=76853 RepID=UPI003F8187E6